MGLIVMAGAVALLLGGICGQETASPTTAPDTNAPVDERHIHNSCDSSDNRCTHSPADSDYCPRANRCAHSLADSDYCPRDNRCAYSLTNSDYCPHDNRCDYPNTPGSAGRRRPPFLHVRQRRGVTFLRGAVRGFRRLLGFQ